ncbi:hypothetical protein ACIA8G_14295 [Lentzea sp. NPDC051213]|uniref:hypothetical protein n=1 Tax=Lentzea sp. NPDC051213 TaxID=3364126 RepID=UPI0037B78146
MSSPGSTSVHTAAARNNAEWCAAVCRSHGIPTIFSETAWHSAHRTPLYYPDAVTLRPDAGDFLHELDTASPGCSIKDSFATLDLTSDGFVEVFTAQWIHRPAGLSTPRPSAPRAERVSTAAHLRDWQAAWRDDEDTPDVFRPALLADPSVLVLAVHEGKDLCGGMILNRGAGLVGVSNLFAVDGGDTSAVWTCALTAAADHFPWLPLVGYERGDDLAPALANGFTVLGPLRVWLHRP